MDYEEKLRVLNLRIQASEVFQNETTDVTSQMEVVLDDALTENRSLREQVKNLKGILNDMFLHGNMPVASKNKGELTIKPSPSPATSSSCVDASPRSCSSASESSPASPLHDSRTKDKREHSPTTKRIRDFHGLCLSGANNVPTVRYIEVPGTCSGHRHHKHHGDIEGEDLEIGAVDKLLVGE